MIGFPSKYSSELVSVNPTALFMSIVEDVSGSNVGIDEPVYSLAKFSLHL